MNPRHITTVPHHTQNPNRSQIFTITVFNTPILTTVTSTPAVARQWVYNLRNNHHQDISSSTLIVGLGVQWHPSSTSAATLQLCVNQNCLIFQLSHAPNIPATLRNLLSDDRVTFVGVHNGRDRNLLEGSDHELHVENLIDLAKEDFVGNNISMEDMAEIVLGYSGIVKPREIGMSDWDQFWLSNQQVQYACVDAYVSYLLALAFGYPKNDDDEDEYYDDEYDDDDDDEYYDHDGDYLNYDDYCNPLNYNEHGEYDPDNCNPFNLYKSDFEDDDY